MNSANAVKASHSKSKSNDTMTPREPRSANVKTSGASKSISKPRGLIPLIFLFLGVLLLLTVAAVSVGFIQFYSFFTSHNHKCPRKCRRPDLLKPHPPLVVLSFDGYARYYLKRKLQPTFDRIAKCGVTAERVFSSYPTLTFPNHYTMATGLYPGHHGLVANTIYDTDIADKPLYLGRNLRDGLYVAEPIWSYYKKATNRKAASYSWIGSQHYSTRYLQPDYTVKYSRELTEQDRFDTILKWLRMEEENRPGLIMTYFDEPDRTGHNTLGEKLNKVMTMLDNLLDEFLETLDREGFLGCINLVIVSDHGMSRIRSHVLLADYFNVTGTFISYGAQAQIFLVNSTMTPAEISNTLGCHNKENARVFTETTMPIRFHYPKTHRIGDLVVNGVRGALIHEEPSVIHWQKSGAHGYDYIEPSVQTIMFATGPSFKENYVLPSFQNVEYLNLFTKLLNISMVKSDGDPVFMDLALKNHRTPRPVYTNMKKCDTWDSEDAPLCSLCSAEEKAQIAGWAGCDRSKISLAVVPQEYPESQGHFCFVPSCEDMAIISTTMENGNSGTLIEMYTTKHEDEALSGECVFQLAKDSEECPRMRIPKGFINSTISAYPKKVLAHERHLILPLRKGFLKVYMEPLNSYTREVVRKRGRLMSITGWVYNYKYDGYYTKLKHAKHPTHIFRILIACKKDWSKKGPHCEDSRDTEALSFILPHVESDPNCMSRKDLLLQYTARIRDVERISGQYFNLTNVPFMEQLVLKLHVNTKLW